MDKVKSGVLAIESPPGRNDEVDVFISREIAASAEEKVHLNKELVELSNSLKELATKVENKVQKFKF